MDTVFINFQNSETSNPHELFFNLADKTILKRSDTYVALQTLAKIIDLKYQLRHGMKSLNYLMDHILYLIFKAILNIS